MGDWLRNSAEKATGGDAQRTRLQIATEQSPETYSTLGIEKTDAFRLQRLGAFAKVPTPDSGGEWLPAQLRAVRGGVMALPLLAKVPTPRRGREWLRASAAAVVRLLAKASAVTPSRFPHHHAGRDWLLPGLASTKPRSGAI